MIARRLAPLLACVIAGSFAGVLGLAAAARADVVIMLQRTNLRSGPSVRNPIIVGVDRYEPLDLLDVFVDNREIVWYQVDRDIRSTYWRYVKYTGRGWIRAEDGYPANVYANPVDGRSAIEIREHGVERQRMKPTGNTRAGWTEIVYMPRDVFLKNKTWVSSAFTCRRPNRTVEEAKAQIAKIAALDIPDEVKNWLIIGRNADNLEDLEKRLAAVDPKDRIAVARDILFADRTLRLGMTPSQVELAWGEPLSVGRVEGDDANSPGMEWGYRSVTARFDRGLVVEIYPGLR